MRSELDRKGGGGKRLLASLCLLAGKMPARAGGTPTLPEANRRFAMRFHTVSGVSSRGDEICLGVPCRSLRARWRSTARSVTSSLFPLGPSCKIADMRRAKRYNSSRNSPRLLSAPGAGAFCGRASSVSPLQNVKNPGARKSRIPSRNSSWLDAAQGGRLRHGKPEACATAAAFRGWLGSTASAEALQNCRNETRKTLHFVPKLPRVALRAGRWDVLPTRFLCKPVAKCEKSGEAETGIPSQSSSLPRSGAAVGLAGRDAKPQPMPTLRGGGGKTLHFVPKFLLDAPPIAAREALLHQSITPQYLHRI
jgi:hypothetical protein